MLLVALLVHAARSESARRIFQPHELFRVPFGESRETLGSRIAQAQFLIPRDFTLDGADHFYIYDVNNHRIARYSSAGKFEMDFRYLATAGQVFAHADSSQNLWLLLSDPARGVYYGVYSPTGRRLREGIFGQFHQFRLHPDDDFTLHIILSAGPAGNVSDQIYMFDEQSLRMKKENVAPPPVTHHQVKRHEHVYFIDAMPGTQTVDTQTINRISDPSHQEVAAIRGSVLYVTGEGEIYTRVGARQINVYEADGTLKGNVTLTGMRGACASIRFDSAGNIYELDGIPDKTDEQLRAQTPAIDSKADFEDLHYTPEMLGMRMIVWERQ